MTLLSPVFIESQNHLNWKGPLRVLTPLSLAIQWPQAPSPLGKPEATYVSHTQLLLCPLGSCR